MGRFKVPVKAEHKDEQLILRHCDKIKEKSNESEMIK
jgi:hypothetical protein